MPTTLPNMGLVQPDIGGSSGTWASHTNANWLKTDTHTHQEGSGARITPAAININANLAFANWHITNLGAIAFSAVAPLAAGTKHLFVSNADNELYWRTNTGTNVKLTDGNGLNMVFAGGIGGDYAAVEAELNYDDGADRYTFRSAGGTKWARIAAGEIRIQEYDTTNSVFIALAVPAGLATQYTLTLPAALPAAGRIMQVAADGTITYSNTVAEAVTLTSGITNTVTLTGGATAAADQHIVVSGTGRFKHGDRVRTMPGIAGVASNANYVNTASSGALTSTGATVMMFPISLHVGERLKSVVFAAIGDGAVDITYTVKKTTSAGVTSDIGGPTVQSNVPGTIADYTVDVTDTTVTDGDVFFLHVDVNATDFSIATVRITYDHP